MSGAVQKTHWEKNCLEFWIWRLLLIDSKTKFRYLWFHRICMIYSLHSISQFVAETFGFDKEQCFDTCVCLGALEVQSNLKSKRKMQLMSLLSHVQILIRGLLEYNLVDSLWSTYRQYILHVISCIAFNFLISLIISYYCNDFLSQNI